MTQPDDTELRNRLRAVGREVKHWYLPADVAAVLGVHRNTALFVMDTSFGDRLRRTGGGHRRLLHRDLAGYVNSLGQGLISA